MKFGTSVWSAGKLLLLLGALAGVLAIRFFKRGAPPTPELAIEEAKKTREALDQTKVARDSLDVSRERGDRLEEQTKTTRDELTEAMR